MSLYDDIDFKQQVWYIYISFSHNPVQKVEPEKKKGKAMLYLRDGNNLTSEQEAAIEVVLAQLGLKATEVRKAIVVSLPEPKPADDELADPDPDPVIASAMAEASRNSDIISFDDVLGHLRRPWWRRWLDKACRFFRR